MSTLKITFDSQPNGTILGTLRFDLTVDGQQNIIELALSNTPGYARFLLEPYDEQIPILTSSAQAFNYGQALVRDFGSIGGVGNIIVSQDGNEITITSLLGTFSPPFYSGDYISIIHEITNSLQPVPKTFDYAVTDNGDCDNVEYTANSATGGTPPYRLVADGSQSQFTDWDGETPLTFQLDRERSYNGFLLDSLGEGIMVFSVIPPRKIQSSDFKTDVTPFPTLGYSDVNVRTVVERAGTGPLEYSLNGVDWQESNVFGGLFTGVYTLYVRDKFGCSVSKQFTVTEFQNPVTSVGRVPYFKISEYNSLSFHRLAKHGVDVRRNYENTASIEEAVGLPKVDFFEFPSSSDIATKFNSSFPFHIVTLFKWDGTKVNLNFSLLQQNLDIRERVDCKVFPLVQEFANVGGGTSVATLGTGVYFDGGNRYVFGSGTVLEESPYTSGLPEWAVQGNIVKIDGVGEVEIIESDLYDEARQVSYFRINERLSEANAIAEVIWDRHPYNVYRFDFNMLLAHKDGNHIKIEPGYDFDNIEQSLVSRSEPFKYMGDESKYIKLAWSAFRNIGEMIFIDSQKGEMWVRGSVRPYSQGNAQTDDADDRTRSIDQEEFLRMRVQIPAISAKKWRKFGLVGAIGNRGTVFIEDMQLVRLGGVSQEELGSSNLSTVTCEFSYTGEPTSIFQEDPVLDISTGLTGKGGTGTEDVEGWQLEDGKFRLTDEDGNLIQVDGYFVEVG